MIKYNITARHKAGIECHKQVGVFYLLMNSIEEKNGCYHLSWNIVNTRNHPSLRLTVYSGSSIRQIFVYQALSRGNLLVS